MIIEDMFPYCSDIISLLEIFVGVYSRGRDQVIEGAKYSQRLLKTHNIDQNSLLKSIFVTKYFRSKPNVKIHFSTYLQQIKENTLYL